jgi:hypothetical protein
VGKLKLIQCLNLHVNPYAYEAENFRMHKPLPLKKGQMLGLCNKDGKLGIGWKEEWSQKDPVQHSYIYSDTLMGEEGSMLEKCPPLSHLILP